MALSLHMIILECKAVLSLFITSMPSQFPKYFYFQTNQEEIADAMLNQLVAMADPAWGIPTPPLPT